MDETRSTGRQAPPEAWSPDALKEALMKGTHAEKLELLRKIGVLGEDGKVAPGYKSWGSEVTRTETED
jgi:hypothetical protein